MSAKKNKKQKNHKRKNFIFVFWIDTIFDVHPNEKNNSNPFSSSDEWWKFQLNVKCKMWIDYFVCVHIAVTVLLHIYRTLEQHIVPTKILTCSKFSLFTFYEWKWFTRKILHGRISRNPQLIWRTIQVKVRSIHRITIKCKVINSWKSSNFNRLSTERATIQYNTSDTIITII